MPLRTVELMCLSVCQGPEGRDRQVDNSPRGGYLYRVTRLFVHHADANRSGGGARRGWMVFKSHL